MFVVLVKDLLGFYVKLQQSDQILPLISCFVQMLLHACEKQSTLLEFWQQSENLKYYGTTVILLDLVKWLF